MLFLRQDELDLVLQVVITAARAGQAGAALRSVVLLGRMMLRILVCLSSHVPKHTTALPSGLAASNWL